MNERLKDKYPYTVTVKNDTFKPDEYLPTSKNDFARFTNLMSNIKEATWYFKTLEDLIEFEQRRKNEPYTRRLSRP